MSANNDINNNYIILLLSISNILGETNVFSYM